MLKWLFLVYLSILGLKNCIVCVLNQILLMICGVLLFVKIKICYGGKLYTNLCLFCVWTMDIPTTIILTDHYLCLYNRWTLA